MRAHVQVEWLNGDKLDDDTLHDLPDEIADAALEDGYMLFSKVPFDDDEEFPTSFVVINLAATRLVDVTLHPEEPEDAAPLDDL